MAFGDLIVATVLGGPSTPSDSNAASNTITEGAAVNTAVGVTVFAKPAKNFTFYVHDAAPSTSIEGNKVSSAASKGAAIPSAYRHLEACSGGVAS